MKGINLKSFSDEIVKIAKAKTPLTKSAAGMGFIRNLGQDLKHAVLDFRHPVASMRAGAEYLRADWNALPKGKFPKTKQLITRGMLFGDALGAPEAFAKEDPTEAGRSRVERVGNWVGSAAGGVMTARRGIAGPILGSTIGGVIGGRAGRVVKGRKPRGQFRSQDPAVEAQPALGEPRAIPTTV